MNAPPVVTPADLTLDQYRQRFPELTQRIGRAEVVAYPQGFHVLEDGVPLTWRPVGRELAVVLVATIG